MAYLVFILDLGIGESLKGFGFIETNDIRVTQFSAWFSSIRREKKILLGGGGAGVLNWTDK